MAIQINKCMESHVIKYKFSKNIELCGDIAALKGDNVRWNFPKQLVLTNGGSNCKSLNQPSTSQFHSIHIMCKLTLGKLKLAQAN
jgi:hypothetical protein